VPLCQSFFKKGHKWILENVNLVNSELKYRVFLFLIDVKEFILVLAGVVISATLKYSLVFSFFNLLSSLWQSIPYLQRKVGYASKIFLQHFRDIWYTVSWNHFLVIGAHSNNTWHSRSRHMSRWFFFCSLKDYFEYIWKEKALLDSKVRL